MTSNEKLLEKILIGKSDAAINFNDLCRLLISLGFSERVRGDHHIFSKEDIVEILNIQIKGGKAKIFQIKQIRQVLLKYRLGGMRGDSL